MNKSSIIEQGVVLIAPRQPRVPEFTTTNDNDEIKVRVRGSSRELTSVVRETSSVVVRTVREKVPRQRCELLPEVLSIRITYEVIGNRSEQGFPAAATFLSTYYQEVFLTIAMYSVTRCPN
ncbi:uncharacterized protein LOC143175158 [Nomia melanderi]|uniref:uncharacterized protein LOC143175158 n=1 Tax=Nomia melanderi TaxID=2448451 RepID=UPI003FCE8413